MAHDLIVFSHLRWNFVFQRPQHLMTRLARERRVFYFEEPIYSESESPRIDCREAQPNVFVCQPFTPEKAVGFHDRQLPWLNELLSELIQRFEIHDWAAWFYTPMALPLISKHKPNAIFYDCMDELSAFLNAPRQLLQREAALLKVADVVFTGGRSLYEAKRERHPQVHCFPSSVDVAHFGLARGDVAEPAEQARLPKPRLGYFGVIDERIDIPLLDALARAHPEWQLIMVGPVVKIDPDSLPMHSNIYYFGQQDYADLPNFLSGWDLCLLPFALNPSTRYISPTKTLEYMVAERPIISTPITDVAEPYGDIVYLGETHDGFIRACEQALEAPSEAHAKRVEKMREVLSRTSWDDTAASIGGLISTAIQDKKFAVDAAHQARNRTAQQSLRRTQRPLAETTATPATIETIRSIPVAVIGAGPTGLSAAYHLGEQALVIEKNASVGGWCRSIRDGGFTFDYAGHIMFSNDPYVHEMYDMLLGDNMHWQNREAWIYSKEVYTRYPFQGALYGLPADVITECILGAIEARFGPLHERPEPGSPAAVGASRPSGQAATHQSALSRNPLSRNPLSRDPLSRDHSSDTRAGKPDSITDCCGDGVMGAGMESTLRVSSHTLPFRNRRKTPRNFEDFIYETWGAGIARHFAIPYNRKLWAVPLREMETSWLGGRVPMPDLGELIEGSLKPAGKPMGPNARFGYPLRGGFQALMDGFVPHLKGELKLRTQVQSIEPAEHLMTLDDGSVYRYDSLISTMPLPHLIAAMGDVVPDAVREAAEGLRHVSVRCVNLGIGRENLTDKHWIYYPEESVFHRVFVQGNASPHCNAPGGFGLTCEITYSEYKALPCDGDALVQRCIEDLIKVGLINADDPVWVANQVDMPHAYVVYDHNRAKHVDRIRSWLARFDITLAGRYSEWQYYNSDHAFIAGRNAAKQVMAQLEKRSALSG